MAGFVEFFQKRLEEADRLYKSEILISGALQLLDKFGQLGIEYKPQLTQSGWIKYYNFVKTKARPTTLEMIGYLQNVLKLDFDEALRINNLIEQVWKGEMGV